MLRSCCSRMLAWCPYFSGTASIHPAQKSAAENAVVIASMPHCCTKPRQLHGACVQSASDELQGAMASVDEAVQQVDVRPLTDLLDGVGQPLQADGGQAAPASDSAQPASTSTADDKAADDPEGGCSCNMHVIRNDVYCAAWVLSWVA